MIKALNTAASGMQAQQTNMEVISNNLANASTAGYKKSRAEFEDLIYQQIREPGQQSGLNAYSPTGVQTGLGVRTSAVQKDFSIGNAQITKNALDIQIEGTGFFQVQTPDGQISYTRDGQFKKDSRGKIVDKNGNALQPEITIPPDASSIEIAATGEVKVTSAGSNEPRQIGSIEIVNFVNPAGLKSMGKNLFSPTGASGQPVNAKPGTQGMGYLAQGQVESSNVNVVEEMVNMIQAQRTYETNSKAIQAADQMMQTVNGLR